MRKLALAVPAAVVASAATATLAFAHAEVKTRVPKPGSSTSAAVRHVSISFGEAVLAGKVVSIRRGTVPVKFTSALNARKTKLTATLKTRLPAGRYTVSWRVRADDGDSETGVWSFTVR